MYKQWAVSGGIFFQAALWLASRLPNKACIGRLGLGAVFELFPELGQFPVSSPYSPQPPVTRAVRQPSKGRKSQMRYVIFCVLLSSLVLSSCAIKQSLASSPVPTLSPISPTTTAILETPTVNYKNIILTPDDLFALRGLEAWSTPNSEDFCEHLPSPQIISNPDNLTILSGRFVLCPWESWPWVTNIIMDLDKGSLVPTDDPGGDIVMFNGRWGTEEKPDYAVINWSTAYLNSAYVLEKYPNHAGANHLSSAYCEDMVQGRTNKSAINVEEGAIACIRTTEGKIALIRVERVYPSNTLSAEFSFVILRTVIATPVITQTPSLTPGPSPTATNTPTNQELLDALDERTQFLFGRPASDVIDFLLEIQNSLRTGNKEKLASLVYYPITIRLEGNQDTEIKNAEEFIANYDKIVTPEWKTIILAQEPARLFTNWQGVMVHRGELWFTGICSDSSCQDSQLYIVTITHTDW